MAKATKKTPDAFIIKGTDATNTSATANGTQNANQPITSDRVEAVNKQLVVRTIDRSPKTLGTLRSAHISAESVYYPIFQRLNDTYEDVLLDRFLSGIIRKRISQVVNKKLLCKRNGEPDKNIGKLIRSKAFKNVMREIIWTKFWGRNGLEFVPGDKFRFNPIPKKHIQPKTQMIVKEQTGLDEGIDYTNIGNVWIMGEPGDLGLLLICAYIALLKKDAIADWAQFIQIFGSPIMVLKYKGFDQSAKVAADNILKNIKNAARVTIPEEMGLTFEDGKQANGDGQLQDNFRKACNEELSILILGNTETTGHSGTGTGAKSKTHSEQQLEIIKDDMDDICDALNSDHFLAIMESYGYDMTGCEFEFDHEVDIAYLKDYIPLVTQAATQMGLPIPKGWLYDLMGIPKPKPGDDTIQLFPVLGQQPTVIDPDKEDGQPPAKPKSKTKPQPQAISLSDVSAMLDEKLKTFFGPAR